MKKMMKFYKYQTLLIPSLPPVQSILPFQLTKQKDYQKNLTLNKQTNKLYKHTLRSLRNKKKNDNDVLRVLRRLVLDLTVGDTFCSECGLVIANESGDDDPVHVDGHSNFLLTDGGLSTVFANPNGSPGEFLSSSLRRWQNRGGANPDRGLIPAFKTIATMSDRLGLVATIKDRANEIYKLVDDPRSSRGRNQDVLLAACLYIACRQEDKPRTVKEICSVANGATKKEIGRAKEYIVKQMGTIHAGDLMSLFCSNLGMNNQAVKAAQEAVQKSEEFDIRRIPRSVAAAVIYIITQLSDDKKPLKDISVATGVAEVTIRNSYKDHYPHVSKIVPNRYAKEDDLKNLCSP